ncbi:hypothetical protein [Actinoplanes awajinensis]|uniref:Uncharacterized protein n=1 Tax=Actinoplanes awajinensis subsp. mycoplanecinus TaxID=135947 RepID=A0A101JE48_9ACTN|nr:hypothetical protein [Actinoplanes awajinensis]KUL25128.1 hypothetical protein ADL15_41310 [Actinoplanes awajinensis subsp. mycoplanecinus]
MDRQFLTLDGIRMTYLPAGVLAPAGELIRNFDELEDRGLAGHPRMRRVLTRLRPNLSLLYYYLHFSDGADLAALDDRVAAGVATDDDFRGALLGEALTISCPHCAAMLRVVEVEPGHPLFHRDRIRRLNEHVFQRECPVCHQTIPHYILEQIDLEPAD